MNTYLLDTNIVSYLARGQKDIQSRFLALEGKAQIVLSVITEAELRYGLAKQPVSKVVRAGLERYLAAFLVLPWTSEAVQAYAQLRVMNEAEGRTLGAFDLLIAAQARAEHATLVTGDATLAAIKGVNVEQW